MYTYVRNVFDSLRTTLKGMQITFRNLRRPVRRRAGKDDDELVAPVAGHEVPWPVNRT